MGFDPKVFLAEPDTTPAFDPQSFLAEDEPVTSPYQPKPGDIPITLPKQPEGVYDEDIARMESQRAQAQKNSDFDILKQEQNFAAPAIAGAINLAGFATELPKKFSDFERKKYENPEKYINKIKNSNLSERVKANKINQFEINRKRFEVAQEDPAMKAVKSVVKPLTKAAKKKTLEWSEAVSPIDNEAAALREELKDVGPGKDKFIDDMVDSYKKGTLDTKINWFGTQAALRGDKKSAELSKQLVDEYRQAQLEDWQKQQQDPDFVGPIKPVTPGKFREIARSVARMAPGLVASAAVSAIPVVGAPMSFIGWAAQGAGQVYQDAVSQGADPEKARVSAAIAGPIYSYIEKAQIGKIVKAPELKKGIVKFLAEYGIDVTKEVNEEGLQGIVTTIGTEIAKGNTDKDDIAKKSWNSYLQNAKESIASLAVVTGASRGVRAAANKLEGVPAQKPETFIQKSETPAQKIETLTQKPEMPAQTGAEILKGISEDEQDATFRRVQGERQAKEGIQNIVSSMTDEEAAQIVAKAKIPGVDATKATTEDLARVKESADKVLAPKKPTGEGSIYNMAQPAPADQEAGKTLAERHGLKFVDATEGPRDQGGVILNFKDEITGKTISAPAAMAESEIVKTLADTRRDNPEEYGKNIASKAGVEFVGKKEELTKATGKGTYESEIKATFKTPLGSQITVPFSATVEDIKKEVERLDNPKTYGESLGLKYQGPWETGHHEFLDNETKSNVTVKNLSDLKEAVKRERQAFQKEKEDKNVPEKVQTTEEVKPSAPVKSTRDTDRMLKMYLDTGKTETALAKETQASLVSVIDQVDPLDIAEAVGITEDEAKAAIVDIKALKKSDISNKVRTALAPSLFYGETVDEAVSSIKKDRAPTAEPAKFSEETGVLPGFEDELTPTQRKIEQEKARRAEARKPEAGVSPLAGTPMGAEEQEAAVTEQVDIFKTPPMKETTITPTKAGLVGTEKKADVPREQTVPPVQPEKAAQPEATPAASPKELTKDEKIRAAYEARVKKIEEAENNRDKNLKDAQKYFKELGDSFLNVDPNALYSIGTRQMEAAFNGVGALVKAGYYDFKSMMLKMSEIAKPYLQIRAFRRMVEAAYDSYAENDADVKPRGDTTVDAVLGITEETPAAPELKSERRKDLVFRKKISEMTDEEKAKALTWDELTGFKTLKAWEDVEKKRVQAVADSDSLKWINDNLGHAAGNKFLKIIGRVFREAGIDGYRAGRMADEIHFQADDTIFIEKAIEKAYNIISKASIRARKPDGTIVIWKGLGFSYGYSTAESTDPEAIEAAIKRADQNLNEDKLRREREHLRAGRGERPYGLSEIPAKGDGDSGRGIEPEQTDLFAPPTKGVQDEQDKENIAPTMGGIEPGIRPGVTPEGETGTDTGRSGGTNLRGERKDVQSGKQPQAGRTDGSDSTKLLSTENAGAAGNSRGDEPVVTPNLPSGEKPRQQLIDYLIEDADNIGIGGPAKKLQDNIDAITVLKKIKSENRWATPEEQKILVRYVGWGGLSSAFKPDHKSYDTIKNLLTPQEYAQARRSTLNAHYTSPTIVKKIWQAVTQLGFNGGNVLEPAIGIGHFFGLRPNTLKMAMSGIEMDGISAEIAKQLYQSAIINNSPYEKVKMTKDYYNLIISNVPFADIVPIESNESKTPGIEGNPTLHNFYFLKSLYGLKPGGVIAFVTTHYTMDAPTARGIREQMIKQADFIGAIRLPKTAFKENAGTEVITDIIFLQKRAPGQDDHINYPLNKTFIETGTVTMNKEKEEGTKDVTIAKYFIDNAPMVIGKSDLKGSMYGPDQYNVSFDGTQDEFVSALDSAISNGLPQNIIGEAVIEKTKQLDKQAFENWDNIEDIPRGSYFIDKGVLYQKNNETGMPEKVTAKGDTAERIRGQVKIKTALRKMLSAQRVGDTEAAKPLLAELNKAYDDFVKKYGFLSDKKNAKAFVDDNDAYLLQSLENYDEKTKKATKQDIFKGISIAREHVIEKTDSPAEALIISLNTFGSVNVDHIAKMLGMTRDEAVQSLLSERLIYKNPSDFLKGNTVYLTREEYLSGNVREKHAIAKKAASKDKSFNDNVLDLEKIIPPDKPAERINVNINSPILLEKDIEDFTKELYDGGNHLAIHNKTNGNWTVSFDAYGPAMTRDYGTDRINGEKLINLVLNGKQPRVFDTVRDSDGKKTEVFNQEATTLAETKVEAIQKRWQEWIWTDQERKERLVRAFNDRFNSVVNAEYIHPLRVKNPDAPVTFPGSAFPYPARKHQADAVWRVIQSKRTMLAHEVGAGKTLEMIWSGQELKRMGLINKPVYVFPNHMVNQWAGDFYKAYPNAKILVAREKDLKPENRKRFINKIATGNWDAVLIKREDFLKIELSPQEQVNQLEKMIEDFRNFVDAFAQDKQKTGGRKPPTVKDIEKKIENFENKIEKLKNQSKKEKGTLYFEDLGIDMLFLDEADEYKNLNFYTSLQGVRGLGSQQGSGRALDMYLKTTYMNEKGNRIVFATGTPISNTMVEAYSMMRYLQPEYLEANGIVNFDDWQRMFAKTVTNMELSNSGTKYVPVSRFSKIVNLQELMQALREVWDIKNAAYLEEAKILVPGKDLPKNKVINISAPLTDLMKSFKRYLVQRENDLKGQKPEKGADNVLVMIGDGRKAAVDFRLFHTSLPNDPNSKLNIASNNIIDIYKKYDKQKYTQIVFFDEPIAYRKDHGTGKPIVVFDAAKSMIDRLVKGGIPREQIALANDDKYEKNKAKAELFRQVRAGEVRVLIGSVKKMGAGTNVQTLGKAIHHIEAKWRPRDFEQANGRFVRQGNTIADFDENGNRTTPENEIGTVEIYNYTTKGSLDSGLWGMLESKAKIIKAIMNNKGMSDEVEEDYFGSIKELSVDDPVLKEAMTLRHRLKELNNLEKAFSDTMSRLKLDIKTLPETNKKINADIAKIQKDIDQRSKEKPIGDNFTITIKGKEYTKREEAFKAFQAIVDETEKKAKDLKKPIKDVEVGKYAGFSLYLNSSPEGTTMYPGTEIYVKGNYAYYASLDKDTKSIPGMFTSLNHTLYTNMENRKNGMEERIKDNEKSILEAHKRIGQTFEHADELKKIKERIAEVDKLLSAAPHDDVKPEDEPVDWKALKNDLNIGASDQAEEDIREIEDEDTDEEEPESPEAPALLRGRAPGSMTLDALKEKIQGQIPRVLNMLPKDLKGRVKVSIGREFTYKGRKFGGDDWEAAVWYDPNGKVVEVHINPNISEDRLAMALMHELPGHIGSRLVYADNILIYNQMRAYFEKMNVANDPSVTKIKRDYEVEMQNDVNNEKLFDEWTAAQLAEYLVNNKKTAVTTRIYNFFRDMLVKLGILPKNINGTLREMVKLMRKGSYERLGGNRAFQKKPFDWQKASIRPPSMPYVRDLGDIDISELTPEQQEANYQAAKEDLARFQEAPRLLTKKSRKELKQAGYDVPEPTGGVVFDFEQPSFLKPDPSYKIVDRRTAYQKVEKEDLPAVYEEAATFDKKKAYNDLRKKYATKKEYNGLIRYLTRTTAGRLLEISPVIRDKIQKHANKVLLDTATYTKQTLPLLDTIKKLPKEDYAVFDLATKNGDTEKINEIAEKHNFTKALNGYRAMMDTIIARAKAAGYETGYLEDYFPRIPKDRAAYRNYMMGLPQWGDMQMAIREKEKEIDRPMTEEETTEFFNLYLRGYGNKQTLAKPANLKERRVQYIDSNMNSLLEDTMIAVPLYIDRMVKKIARRELFGKTSEETDPYLEESLDESIGEYVSKLVREEKLTLTQQDELLGLLKSYFNYQPAHKTIRAIKSMSHITAMGSGFSSMFSQMQDAAITFWTAPTQATGAIARALVGKAEITAKDLGIDDQGADFRDPGKLAKFTSGLLGVVGLRWGDLTFKNAFIQANLEKYRAQARTGNLSNQLKRDLKNIFGAESQQVLKDLREGNNTDAVKILLMNQQSKFIPNTVLQTTQMYLDHPIWRVIYTLKTYQVAQLNGIYDEAIRAMEGAKDLSAYRKAAITALKIIGLLVAMGIGMDALKDWIFRRRTTLPELVVDNLMKMVFVSRFVAWKMRNEGVTKALFTLLLPPVSWVDYIGKDIYSAATKPEDFAIKNMETLRILPVVGQEYYWWFGKGAETTRKRMKKDLPPIKFDREMSKLDKKAELAHRLGDYKKRDEIIRKMDDMKTEYNPKIEKYFEEEKQKQYPKRFKIIQELEESKIPRLNYKGEKMLNDLTPGEQESYRKFKTENREKKQ